MNWSKIKAEYIAGGISQRKLAEKYGVSNVRFLNIRAECLPCYIPENSVEKIYLNFSTPLPKLGYVNQRLTHRGFLETYKKLLKDNGCVIQKTDNRDFFDFSLEEFKEFGANVSQLTFDLHNSEWEKDNIHTEYEDNFSAKGFTINRVEAYVK